MFLALICRRLLHWEPSYTYCYRALTLALARLFCIISHIWHYLGLRKDEACLQIKFCKKNNISYGGEIIAILIFPNMAVVPILDFVNEDRPIL